ncbi:phage major capsid protein [Lactiplantibacillus plantarum]|uniref:phage major capsid protein n=1 Tax=Lactiplantibacillus plantarum TaxID=1590 RepID=UPI00155B22A9|nr:phage major capsid protein [Lactiplantibacillus plantarum]
MTLTATKNNQIDVRSLPASFKTRDVQDNDGNVQHIISGTAVVFNQPSSPMPFVEVISDQAFNGVDLSDVKLLYSHDFGNILARTDAGTLQLDLTDNGLDFTATLPDTQLGHDVYTDILNGNLKGMSFGFTIDDDSWSVENGVQVHTINQIGVIAEISITSLPAYTETSLMVQRSLDKIATQSSESNESNNNNDDKGDQTMAEDNKDQDSQAPVSDAPASDAESKASEAQTSQAPADDSQATKPTSGEAVVTPEIVAQVVKAIQSMVKPADQPADEQTRDDLDDSDDSGDDDSSDDSELEQDSNKTKLEKRDNSMKQIKPGEQPTKDELETRSFVDYMKSQGETRDGVKTVGNEAVIPSAILNLQEQPNDPANLAQYINRQSVTAPKGDLPILQKNTGRLVSKAELADNPSLENFGIKSVDYAVETLAGVLPVSYEMISDGAVDIPGIVSDYVNEARQLTEQEKIGAVLQTASPVAATTADDLKDAFNIGLSNYTKMIVASESAYADIDKLKDGNGRYLFQDSISSASGKSLFGAPVVVVPDTVLGKAGEAHLFIGDLKSFVLEAYKDEVTVKWTDNDIWGQKASVYLRADFKPADTDAGKFVTFTPASSTK